MGLWPLGTRLLSTPLGLSYARGRFGSNAPTVRLLLAHGLGSTKEVWAPTLKTLSTTLASTDGVEWLPPHFSRHGGSRAWPEPTSDEPHPKWNIHHAAEVTEVLRDISAKDDASGATDSTQLVGVGHSMGGAVLCALELNTPGTFAHVAAVEPPLFTRASAALARTLSNVGGNWMAKKALRRRSTWPSRAEAHAHFASRSGRAWAPDSLEAFVAYGLHDAADESGAVVLACRPQTESQSLSWPGEPLPTMASGYSGDASFSLIACAASEFSPVGLPGTGIAYYRHAIAPSFPGRGAAVRVLEGATHSVAQEQPELMAAAILEELSNPSILGSRLALDGRRLTR